MNELNDTHLFIPDISGFTSFVSATEINHSRHIIAELLEITINSDGCGMQVSEIEGDAVLFCKTEPVSMKESITQCERSNRFKGLLDIINIFTFVEVGDHTLIYVELDYKIKSWTARLMRPLVHGKLNKQTNTLFERLKKVSEENAI